MRIRANTWHLQVFRQAYIHDRYWLDFDAVNPYYRPDLPEIAALDAFERECREMTPDQYESNKTQEKLRELTESAEGALNKWRWEQQAVYESERSQEVRERLDTDRTSLCPYFWKVVAALLVYYGVIRSTRPLRQFFNRAAPILATGLVVLILVGLASGVGYVGYTAYENRDKIPTPAEIVAGIKNEYRVYGERQRLEEEYRQRQLQERLEWERANPQEAVLRRQQEEQYRQQQEERRAQERALARQYFKSDTKELAIGVVVLVGILIGVFIGVFLVMALLYYMVLSSGKFFAFLTRLFRPVVAPLSPRFRRATAAWRQFWNDTRELVAAFIKAKKERVCPYITIVNGENLT